MVKVVLFASYAVMTPRQCLRHDAAGGSDRHMIGGMSHVDGVLPQAQNTFASALRVVYRPRTDTTDRRGRLFVFVIVVAVAMVLMVLVIVIVSMSVSVSVSRLGGIVVPTRTFAQTLLDSDSQLPTLFKLARRSANPRRRSETHGRRTSLVSKSRDLQHGRVVRILLDVNRDRSDEYTTRCRHLAGRVLVHHRRHRHGR
jgi:hypothetical protein